MKIYVIDQEFVPEQRRRKGTGLDTRWKKDDNIGKKACL